MKEVLHDEVETLPARDRGFTLLGPTVPQGQAVTPAKDVNVVNTPLPVDITNTPVPVVVQNGANFEFSGTAQNSAGTLPSCLTTTDVFTVPTGERFIVTDVIISMDFRDLIVDLQRDGTRIFPVRTSVPGELMFHHAFQTGLAFEDGQTLSVAITQAPDCSVGTADFVVTGIRTTS